MNGPRTLPILYLSDRIMTYGTAVCPQSLQVQDQADSYAGAGASVCLATLPGTLQRGVAGAAGRLAKMWRGGYNPPPRKPPGFSPGVKCVLTLPLLLLQGGRGGRTLPTDS